jgi:hypothetical protein
MKDQEILLRIVRKTYNKYTKYILKKQPKTTQIKDFDA